MATSKQIDAYFSHLVTALGRRRDVASVAVAHMVPNTISFAPALNQLTSVAALLPKPKSVNRPEYSTLSERFKTLPLTREWASDPGAVVETLKSLNLEGKPVVILDIGGYFATSIDHITSASKAKILGVMEGTENGIQKYEARGQHTTPIVTVARSPLKLPEDHLVASSVVFSVEATLRERAEILQTRSAAVIGYGRVGSSIAAILRSRGIGTAVFDTNPIRLAEAAARGFRACRRLADSLTNASLVVCATGNKSLDLRAFALLKDGCVVASVTSADDEFDLPSLERCYIRTELSSSLTQYQEDRGGDPTSRTFYLVAGGNAANFLHGAVIGPAMQLIEGEKLAAVRALIDEKAGAGISELTSETRNLVAGIWNDHFL